MTRSVRIHVLDTDIAKGKRGSYCGCPVAIAINRHLKETARASVSLGLTRILTSDDTGIVDAAGNPRSVSSFITRFDRLLLPNPRPFFFDIELPVAVLS